jgi:hypothetical protein
VLTLPPSAQIITFGEAMFKRVQWRKGCIVVSPKVILTQISSKPPLLGGSAKSSLKDLLVSNFSSSQDEKVKSPLAREMCASKEHVEGKKRTNKSTRAPTEPPLAPRAAKSDTKWDQ